MKLSPRRAETLSLVALVLQVLFFLLALLVAKHVNSIAVRVEAWHFLGGAGIWLILLLQFRQRRLAQEERFDAEQYQRMRQEGKDTSVFEGTMAEDQLQIAGRRLVWMEKYLLAIFAVLNAGYLMAIGFWLLKSIIAQENPVLAGGDTLLESVVFMIGLGLVSFLFSRYAVGMSRQDIWRPLRAGGSYLFSNALASITLAVALLIAKKGDYLIIEQIVGYVLATLMIAIGFETILNLLLDAYRPRIKGVYRRAAYESRLLGLFSEPGGLIRTATHAIDYQFGFKVSETWFYKLLEKTVLPMLILQGLILYLMTSLAVVPAGNIAVLERFGNPKNIDSPYNSGLHFKLPWPIDKIRNFPVEQTQIVEVGFVRKEPKYDDAGRKIPDMTPILWTKEHWKEEFSFMLPVARSSAVLVPQPADSSQDESSLGQEGVKNIFDMLVVALVIHYRVDDIGLYAYGPDGCYREPHNLIDSICNRQTVHYCATSAIDKLLGAGRQKTTQALKKAINDKVKEHKLGVEIFYVALESVHPPINVAESFEQVVSALQNKQAAILEAQGEVNKTMAEARGDRDTKIYAAESYAFKRATIAQADALRFQQQLEAYQKGREIYLWREFLTVLDQNLGPIRKYVVASDDVDSWIYQFDLTEPLQAEWFTGLGPGPPEEE